MSRRDDCILSVRKRSLRFRLEDLRARKSQKASFRSLLAVAVFEISSRTTAAPQQLNKFHCIRLARSLRFRLEDLRARKSQKASFRSLLAVAVFDILLQVVRFCDRVVPKGILYKCYRLVLLRLPNLSCVPIFQGHDF